MGDALRLVLFDLDGTLLFTDGAGRRALIRALEAEVGTTGPAGRHRFDGKTDPQIVRELLAAVGHPAADDPERVEAVCRRYLVELAQELARPGRRTRLLDGVAVLLERLEQRADAVLGLLTGNVAEGAALKLHSAGLDPARFRVGAYGSDSADRNSLPAVAAARAARLFGRAFGGPDLVIVGDTPADVACGTGFGARAVGVATGSYSVDDLLAAGAHAAFAHLGDTDRVLAAVLG